LATPLERVRSARSSRFDFWRFRFGSVYQPMGGLPMAWTMRKDASGDFYNHRSCKGALLKKESHADMGDSPLILHTTFSWGIYES